ncbi:alcohol oxidase [Testicularia cyperi]|uniref:Alcohol oxidase n=1 Tax=Testicularia cyperi TaxID=1882483 RepID=A0A317XMC3_9BASI|nr:alcohol oxidase [Testicularia cyperi]
MTASWPKSKRLVQATALTAVVGTAVLCASAGAVPFGQPPATDYSLFRRSLTTNGNDLSGQTYDYVVVGGGLAGLVVASRLTENSNVTVAVIEAGAAGYEDNEKFVVPAANLYNSAVGTEYDWQWQTTNQPGLANRRATWPRGKVLGGSSAINGLYYVRHSQIEQDAWSSLIGQNASSTWGWDSMLAAMKKSEDYTPPNQRVSSSLTTSSNTASHGNDGPLHVSYPAVTYPAVGAFLQAAAQEGTAISTDPDAGQSWGAFLATSNINPSNWTRSFSRTAYLDPFTYRSNLNVLTGHQVTKIVFDGSKDANGNVRATGVQYAAASGQQTHTVNARREVILSAGAINDPQILQLSGVADRGLLSSLDIQTVVDLPGVGYHLQDHLSTGVVWAPAQGVNMPPASVTGNAETDSYVNSAIAYVSGATIFGNEWNTIVSDMRSNLSAAVDAYNAPASVKEGYRQTYTSQIDKIFPTDIGPIELLFALSFGGIQVQAALQHPLSRGSIKITSQNPFAAPAIDPAYLSNEVDMSILREGFKLARRVGQQSPLSNYIGNEQAPGSGVQSDSQWENWIRGTVGTEYHPSSTCSMLPRDQGGVVDADLLVYGTNNLRVIDASVPPISFAAHLMSITYGLAEIGAELIQNKLQADLQAANNQASATASSSNAAATTSGGSRPATSNSSSSSSSAAASSLLAGLGAPALSLVVVLVATSLELF